MLIQVFHLNCKMINDGKNEMKRLGYVAKWKVYWNSFNRRVVDLFVELARKVCFNWIFRKAASWPADWRRKLTFHLRKAFLFAFE